MMQSIDDVNLPRFGSLSAYDRFKRLRFLFVTMQQLVSKDYRTLKPLLYMIIYSMLQLSFVFAGFILVLVHEQEKPGYFSFLIAIILSLYKPFFVIKCKAKIAAIFYGLAINGSADEEIARQKYEAVRGRLFIVGLIDRIAQSKLLERKKQGFFIMLLFSFLEEVWDLLKNFVVPVVVIEGKTLKESISELKHLRDKTPEVLAGILGFDFLGRFLLLILAPFNTLITILCVGIGSTIAHFYDIPSFSAGPVNISITSILLSVYFVMLLSAVVKCCVYAVKSAYFTVVYMMISRPEAISESVRSDLEDFVLMKRSIYV